MTRERKPPNPPKPCIFCEGHGLSKEHIIPNWMRSIFIRSESDMHRFFETLFAFNSGDPRPHATTNIVEPRPSRASTVVLRVVCRNCNNGWLSELENRAKPLLEPLVRGEPLTLQVSQQWLLATWIAKTVMVTEFMRPNEAAIPQRQRTFLKDELLPPLEKWRIHVGTYGGPPAQSCLVHSHNFIKPRGIDAEPGATKNNTQSTLIGLGRLIAFVISTTAPGLVQLGGPTEGRLARIWPESSTQLTMPLAQTISPSDFLELRDILMRIRGANYR